MYTRERYHKKNYHCLWLPWFVFRFSTFQIVIRCVLTIFVFQFFFNMSAYLAIQFDASPIHPLRSWFLLLVHRKTTPTNNTNNQKTHFIYIMSQILCCPLLIASAYHQKLLPIIILSNRIEAKLDR